MYILGLFKFKRYNEVDEYFRIEYRNFYKASESSDFYNYIKW